MSRTTIRRLVASAAATSILFVAGCGVERADTGGQKLTSGRAELPTPVDRPENFEGTGGVIYLQQAAEATTEVDTMRSEVRMEMGGGPVSLDMFVTSEIDVANDLTKTEMDMSDILGSFQMPESDDMPDLSGADLSLTMIQDGDTVYLRSPLYQAMGATTKEWVSLDAAAMGADSPAGQQKDPQEFLKFLKNSGSDVTEEGEEELRGVPTTHLSTVLDLRTIMEEAPDEDKAEMEDALADLGEGFSEIPMDVWVDADGLVRKMVMVFDLSSSGDTDLGDASITLTMEMFDFGEPLDIEVPDAADVEAVDPADLGMED